MTKSTGPLLLLCGAVYLAAQPVSVPAQRQRASDLFAQGKRLEALPLLEELVKADPNDALGWVRLMRAYTVLGKTDKAKQALADARKAFPANKDAQTAFTTAAKALKLE